MNLLTVVFFRPRGGLGHELSFVMAYCLSMGGSTEMWKPWIHHSSLIICQNLSDINWDWCSDLTAPDYNSQNQIVTPRKLLVTLKAMCLANELVMFSYGKHLVWTTRMLKAGPVIEIPQKELLGAKTPLGALALHKCWQWVILNKKFILISWNRYDVSVYLV